MTTRRALIGLLVSVTTVACAVQLDEPPTGADSPDPGAAGNGASGATGVSGATSAGKGGGAPSGGSTSSGGATSSSAGEGGTTSSGGKGGQAGGGQPGAGNGGSDGGSTSAGGGGSGGGGTVTASCAGLPEWVAETNPTPPIMAGEAFTYMNQKYVHTGAMPVTYWNGECPPEPSRPTWCETNYAFTGPTPCE